MNSQELFRSKKFFIYLIIFVIVLIFLFIFTLTKLIIANSQCVQNPFTYAANQIILTSESLDLETEIPSPLCSCSVGQSIFYFDHEGMYREYPKPYVSEIEKGSNQTICYTGSDLNSPAICDILK